MTKNMLELDLKVKSLSKTVKETEEVDVTTYKMVLKDREGLNEVVFKSAEPFTDITTKTKLSLVLHNPQTTLKESVEKEN